MQDRAYSISPPGWSLSSSIFIASQFNIAQRCAANVRLTLQRAAANPHSSSEPRSHVTAVGVGQTGAGERPAMTKDFSRHIQN